MAEEHNGGQGQADAKPAASGAKVPLQKRILGGLIDGVVAGVAGAVAATVGGILWAPLAGILSGIVGSAYWLLRDSILGNGQSIGKKVMGYQVVGPDGKPCSQDLSLRRNAPLALGSIFGLIISTLVAIPGLGVVLAFLALLVSPIIGLVTLAIVIAEIYFINGDPNGNRWGDKFAGTTTKLVG